MQITILTYGSRGDVQPFLALAVELKNAGHQVRLAAPQRFASFVGEYGVPFVPLAGDPAVISQRLNDAGGNLFRMVPAVSDYVFEIAPQAASQALAACEDADLIVHSFLFTSGGNALARKLGIRDLSIQTFPFFAPSGEIPVLFAPHLSSPQLRKFLHWFAMQVYWQGGKVGYRRLRKTNPEIFDLDLRWPFPPGPNHRRTPLVFAISPTVLPQPGEWPESQLHIPGYFFLEAAKKFQPPEDLTRFLAAGEAPVCVTFGSTIHKRGAEINRMLLQAIAQTKNRAILLSGWGQADDAPGPDHIFTAEAVPHDWLLPRCKAVIHHGGAGTTAAGLRAGIPNLVTPFASDQPFWGQRVHAIGAGPAPIPVKKISTPNLITSLIEMDAPAMRRSARHIGEKIQAENGIAKTIALIESLG